MNRKSKPHIDKRMEGLRQDKIKHNRRKYILVAEIFLIILLSVATYGMLSYNKVEIIGVSGSVEDNKVEDKKCADSNYIVNNING